MSEVDLSKLGQVKKIEWPECPICHSKETVSAKLLADKRKTPDGFLCMEQHNVYLDDPKKNPEPEIVIKNIDICANCGLERYTRVMRIKKVNIAVASQVPPSRSQRRHPGMRI
jgi:hypothetical protein